MELQVQFANVAQKAFYYSTARNQCFSGGFNNGKTYSGCLKAFTLLSTFSNYRYIIARQTFADLKRTTMETFFKICPKEFVRRHNEQDGRTELVNNSTIFWLHLDKVDEGTLRGIEPNSVLIDQGEEVEEKVYDVLDGRVGRWDNAIVPDFLLEANPNWPRNKRTQKPIAPSYLSILCNPDTQFHFIFRKYHPDSLERKPAYFFVEGEWDKSLGSEETYNAALDHDEEWVAKYVKGQWGVSKAQIHRLLTQSIIDPHPELLEKIKSKGNLFRVLDHGDASPTCCLWFAVLGGVYICYREYYMPDRVISYHRQAITDLSGDEKYTTNYADPQIFKKTAQKDGGFWTVADEYFTKDISAPPLYWLPADNNEHATRNRINELLRPSTQYTDPVTSVSPAPGIYYIKRTPEYPQGCFHAISEIQAQRHKLLGYVDGKAMYCDDRDDKVVDHAYDCSRYFIAMHGTKRSIPAKQPKPMTIAWFKMMQKRKKTLAAASDLVEA